MIVGKLVSCAIGLPIKTTLMILRILRSIVPKLLFVTSSPSWAGQFMA